MALTKITLATELKKIANGIDEATARAGWAAAFVAYVQESTVLGISPASAAVLSGARSAMDAALVGMATPQAALLAAQRIVAAMQAFWLAALASGTLVWVTAPVLVPAPFTLPTSLLTPPSALLVSQALAATFTSNTVGSKSKVDCYDALATVLHGACLGATVTQVGSPPVPGIAVL